MITSKQRAKLFFVLVLSLLLALAGCYSGGSAEPQESVQEPELPDTPYGSERRQELPTTVLPDYTGKVREKQGQNEDSVGWIYVPDTGIDDVVLYTPKVMNADNFYLAHNFEGNEDKYGAFFADRRALFGDRGRSGLAQMTAIYGHSFDENPESGMFSGLKKYRDEQFAREHPYLYFSTAEENMAFAVVAVFEAHVGLPYIHSDMPASRYDRMLDAVKRSSFYDYGADIGETDRLLTLSTCAMSVQGHDNLDPYATEYRFVVMGKLAPPDAVLNESAELTINPSPVPPDAFSDFENEM